MNKNNDYGKENIVEISQFVRFILGIAVVVPPLFFMYLQFRNVDIKPVISNVTAEWLRKISLFLYYSAWVYGCRFEIRKQEATYIVTTGKFSKNVKKNAILFAVLLTGVFLILCWVGDDYKKLSIFLAIFWLVNFVGFFINKRIVTPSIEGSYRLFKAEGNLASELRLKFVDEYIRGKWQIYRFLAGSAFVAILVILSFYATFQLIPSVTFLCYVVFVEGWIYSKRFKLSISLNIPKKIREFGFELKKCL